MTTTLRTTTLQVECDRCHEQQPVRVSADLLPGGGDGITEPLFGPAVLFPTPVNLPLTCVDCNAVLGAAFLHALADALDRLTVRDFTEVDA